ncbi:flagellar motor switch protein FliG [Mesorhizobium xinjiangense]|uniref:flagellar motor switch protein FliG n=1 Tax=Mesorhizobium xinjiangense TaxID=2678685 RepID=UPI001F422E9B|nr:flagellar motor switch protein FliG [Mesorhizobium xinjiangense]
MEQPFADAGGAPSMHLPFLTRAQKAAAILVAMGKPAAGKLLKYFSHEELKSLIEAARLLKTIPQSELERIIAEFEDEFAEGAGLMDSAATMDKILNESLSPEEVSAIMRYGAVEEAGDGTQSMWEALENLEPDVVGSFLANERPQTAALILTNLASGVAAKVMVTMPKATRGEVMKRMVAIGPVKPQAMKIVESNVRLRLLGESAKKSSTAGQARVATLLNQLDKSDVDEMLADLEGAGSADVAGIRAQLFAFEDVVHMGEKARRLLFDGFSTEIVTIALRGASSDISEAVLSALGARSRRMIESELSADDGNTPSSDITKARRAIASTAIRMAGDGLIELPSAEDAVA